MSKSGKKQEMKQDEFQPEKPEFAHTGQYLQKLRTDRGLTVKDVSNATRISEVNLNAIEAQDFQALPADTFTKGFLSLYAKFLGVDHVRVVQQFMEERDSGRPGGKRPRTVRQPGNLLTPKTLAEPSHFSSVTSAAILLVIIVVLFTVFCFYTSWNPFSFLLSDRNKSFESIMTGLEQSFPVPERDTYGTSQPDQDTDGNSNASPPELEHEPPQPAPGRNLEEHEQSPRPDSLSGPEPVQTPSAAGEQKTVLHEGVNSSAVLTFSEEPQGLQGDE